MDVEGRLASDLLDAHPIDAARALEKLPAREVAALVAKLEEKPCAGMLQCMLPSSAAAVLSELDRGKAAGILDHLPVEVAALCLRRTDPPARDELLSALPERRARGLRATLKYREGTAASLMDPEVLALPDDLTVREAVARVREASRHARYNLYVVDRDHMLVGVMNLRELLTAPRGARLAALMRTEVHKLSAQAQRRVVVTHPGWREVHSLPVVDERGLYLGAVRYRTLKLLEDEMHATVAEEGATARALGGLLRAGASAMLEAMAASTPRGAGSTTGRRGDGTE
jgi:magnesium transporter